MHAFYIEKLNCEMAKTTALAENSAVAKTTASFFAI